MAAGSAGRSQRGQGGGVMGLALDIAGDILIVASCFVPRHLDAPVTLAGGLSWVAGGAMSGNWVITGWGVLMIAIAIRTWWRRRRGRAPRSYGAKSRALLAAVVAKMRQSLRPRPVRRLAPGGAT